MGNFLINQKIKKNQRNQRFWFFWFLWLIEMVYIHPTSTKVSVELTKICGNSSLCSQMVNNSISCFGWTLRSKIIRKSKKSKNQRKSKSLILLIIWLFSRLCIGFLLYLLFLIYCGICTKQEMELLPCDLTPYHLCQFYTDLCWGRMYG